MKNDAKTALIILTYPNSNLDDVNGNCSTHSQLLMTTSQPRRKKSFSGSGNPLASAAKKTESPFHSLFEAVKYKIQEISSVCAVVFGANTTGFDLITTNAVPGTSGLSSFVKLQEEGYQIITF